jgi:hypothetical protein
MFLFKSTFANYYFFFFSDKNLLGDLLIGWLVFNANLGDNKIAIKE